MRFLIPFLLIPTLAFGQQQQPLTKEQMAQALAQAQAVLGQYSYRLDGKELTPATWQPINQAMAAIQRVTQDLANGEKPVVKQGK